MRLITALFIVACTSFGQEMRGQPPPLGYTLEVHRITEDLGKVISSDGKLDLSGYSCYRVYVKLRNPDDFLSSVSGGSESPLYVRTTTHFFQSKLGGSTPNNVNPVLFSVYPDLAYDSWVSIGLEHEPEKKRGEALVAAVQSTTNSWLDVFDPGGGQFGQDIIIDDAQGGAWYALNGDSNGLAGEDLMVLIGQFTTNGQLSITANVQVFPHGVGRNGHVITLNWPTDSQVRSELIESPLFSQNAFSDGIELKHPAPVRFRQSEAKSPIEVVAVLSLDGANCTDEPTKANDEASVVEQELLGVYGVVDRSHLEMIMEEQRLALSGLVMEEGSLAKAGCLAGAQGTVIVTKGCLLGDDVITIKMLDCTSSMMHWVASGPVERVYDIMDEVRAQLK